jgi:hypothetical protein
MRDISIKLRGNSGFQFRLQSNQAGNVESKTHLMNYRSTTMKIKCSETNFSPRHAIYSFLSHIAPFKYVLYCVNPFWWHYMAPKLTLLVGEPPQRNSSTRRLCMSTMMRPLQPTFASTCSVLSAASCAITFRHAIDITTTMSQWTGITQSI